MASSVLRAARPTATSEAPLEGQLPGSDKPFCVAFDVMMFLRVLAAMKRCRFGCPRGFAFWGIPAYSDNAFYVTFGYNLPRDIPGEVTKFDPGPVWIFNQLPTHRES